MCYWLITVCSQVGDRGVVITTPVRLPQDNEGLSITDIVRQSPVPVLIAHACKPKRVLSYLQFHFQCLTGLWKASHVSTNVDVGHKMFMSSILAGVVLCLECWSPLMGVLSGRKCNCFSVTVLVVVLKGSPKAVLKTWMEEHAIVFYVTVLLLAVVFRGSPKAVWVCVVRCRVC